MRRLVVLVALAASLVAVGCNEGGSGGELEVPDLMGMQYRPAAALLEKKGFRWQRKGERDVHSKRPPNNVISTADDDYILDQEPDAGERVDRGVVIVIEVSCSLEPLPDGAVCID